MSSFTEGPRIPLGDFDAYREFGKQTFTCKVVGCDAVASCDAHSGGNLQMWDNANRAFEKARGEALTYLWGRGDMGDTQANDHASQNTFALEVARAHYRYAMEYHYTRGNLRAYWAMFAETGAIA